MSLSSIFLNSQDKRLKAFFRILFYILLAILFTTPVALLGESMNEFVEKSFLNLFIMIGMLLATWVAGKFLDKRPWPEFGISLFPFKGFALGILTGAVLISIIFGIQYLMGWIELKTFQFNKLAGYGFWLVMTGQFIRYICGSVFEETFSRGYLLRNIAEGVDHLFGKNTAVFVAYIFTSSLFGILHLANDNSSWLSTLNLILIGLLFGYSVIKTGKLNYAIGLHASWNIFQNIVFGAPNSGKNPVSSLMMFENSGEPLWTGGDFGIEGGLICTFIVGGYLVFLFIKSNRKTLQEVLN